MGIGTGNPRIMKSGMGRGGKSPNPRGDPRSPLGTGMGMKNDSPMGMGMRLINGDGDGVPPLRERIKARVSPINGHPKLPGGRFLVVVELCRWTRKKHRAMKRKKTTSNIIAIR
ncbi:hypothetical protein Tco_0905312 [Tanacetum coccineum]